MTQPVISVELEKLSAGVKDLSVTTARSLERAVRSGKLLSIEDRLKQIQEALAGVAITADHIKLLAESSSANSSQGSDGSKAYSKESPGTVEETAEQNASRGTSGQVLYDTYGQARYFHSTSLASLNFQSSKTMDAVMGGMRELPGGSRSLHDPTVLQDFTNRSDLSCDGLPLVLPPRVILDAIVGPFFSDIHGILPIFDRENFTRNLNEMYSQKPGYINRAWALCFTNVVLLTLVPKALQTPMDRDILKSFTDNSRRGFQYLTQFFQPDLCNIQALITMVLVVQENGEASLSNLFLSQACQLARAMGLHQLAREQHQLEDRLREEYMNVFWSLYILDTTSCFTMDKPKYLPLIQCHVGLPRHDPDRPTAFVPRILLAQEQEDIFNSLYSAEAMEWSTVRRNQHCSRLLARLETLEERFPGMYLKASENTNHVRFQDLEFAFRTSRILIQRSRIQDSGPSNLTQDVVQSLELFLSLQNNKTDMEAQSILLRLLETHSFVAFFQLFDCVVLEPRDVARLASLEAISKALRSLQSSKVSSGATASHLSTMCTAVDKLLSLKSYIGRDEEMTENHNLNEYSSLSQTNLICLSESGEEGVNVFSTEHSGDFGGASYVDHDFYQSLHDWTNNATEGFV
ncbi:hypothetical protein VE03_04350 [Pseudogymnoascus sp. 23342-1-I1]|nr:hypothetical protein VE03_04350 [Pseudogymnoascus sp. 23342-1-I1]